MGFCDIAKIGEIINTNRIGWESEVQKNSTVSR